jgi:ribosomal protein L24E
MVKMPILTLYSGAPKWCDDPLCTNNIDRSTWNYAVDTDLKTYWFCSEACAADGVATEQGEDLE